MPDVQRRRRDLHRTGRHGDRRSPCEECEEAIPSLGAGVHVRRPEHRRGARDARHRGRGVLRRRRGADTGRPQDPRPAGRRRPRLPQPRTAAHHAVGRRAPAAQAGHPDGREGRRLRPRRADLEACTSPTSSSCSGCSTGSSTPAGRSSSSSTTRRSWPTPTGSSTSAPAPAMTAAASSSRAHPPTWSRPARSTLTGEHLAAYVGGRRDA